MSEYDEVINTIYSGHVDDHLMDINHALAERQKVMGKVSLASIKVGDRMQFTSDVGKGMAGKKVTVTQKMRTNVEITTDDGQVFTGNPAMLEPVS